MASSAVETAWFPRPKGRNDERPEIPQPPQWWEGPAYPPTETESRERQLATLDYCLAALRQTVASSGSALGTKAEIETLETRRQSLLAPTEGAGNDDNNWWGELLGT